MAFAGAVSVSVYGLHPVRLAHALSVDKVAGASTYCASEHTVSWRAAGGDVLHDVGLWMLRAFCAWHRDWADFACQDGRRVPGLRPLIVVRDRTAQRWRRLVLMSGAGSLWGAQAWLNQIQTSTNTGEEIVARGV